MYLKDKKIDTSKIREGSDIAYTKDVLKRASEELGVPYKEVEKVYYDMIAFMKHIVRYTPHTRIALPNFCSLYLKVGDLNHLIKIEESKKRRGKKYDEEFLKSLYLKKLKLDGYLTGLGHDIMRSHHVRVRKIKSSYYTDGRHRNPRDFAELERIQKKVNGYTDKHRQDGD